MRKVHEIVKKARSAFRARAQPGKLREWEGTPRCVVNLVTSGHAKALVQAMHAPREVENTGTS